MATQVIKRPKLNTGIDYTFTLSAGWLTEQNNLFYLPLTFDNFSAPNLTKEATDGASAANTITAGTAGDFDDLRPGDEITASSVGTFTTPSTFTRDCVVVGNSKMVIYPNTFTASNLNVHAGDAVSGTGIGASAKVDKIDYSRRIIYLDVDNTADGAGITLTFAPPVRITAVRLSTATSNANQIDINTTIDDAIVDGDLTIKNGAREAVYAVLRTQDVDNTTGSRANTNIGVAYLDGKEVKGSASGLNGIDVTALNYVAVGTIGFDADAFLTNARVPKVNS